MFKRRVDCTNSGPKLSSYFISHCIQFLHPSLLRINRCHSLYISTHASFFTLIMPAKRSTKRNIHVGSAATDQQLSVALSVCSRFLICYLNLLLIVIILWDRKSFQLNRATFVACRSADDPIFHDIWKGTTRMPSLFCLFSNSTPNHLLWLTHVL